MHSFLIISGPLLSYGQGATYSFEGYKVSDSVISNFHAFSRFFDRVIFFTWSASTPIETGILERIKIACGSGLLIRTSKQPTMADLGNRYKQFLSIQLALCELGDVDPSDKIVRIRSDIIYSDDLVRFAAECDISGKFWVSEIQNQLLYLGDFLYISSVESMRKYVWSTLRWRSRWIHPSNVSDYTIKFYLPFNTFTRFIACMPFGKVILMLLSALIMSRSAISFRAVPGRMLSTSLWRGVTFASALPVLFNSSHSSLLSCPRTLTAAAVLDSIIDYYTLLFQKVYHPRMKYMKKMIAKYFQ